MSEPSVIDYAIAVLCGAGIVATILKNGPNNYLPEALRNTLNSSLASWLVPIWTFFAPNPGTRSYHLLYRDRYAEGEVGDWQQITLERRSPWLCALWNPAKTAHKALIDVINELGLVIQTAPVEARESVQLSIPYLTVLSHVAALPRSPRSFATQFLLLRSTPADHEVYYLSGVHRL